MVEAVFDHYANCEYLFASLCFPAALLQVDVAIVIKTWPFVPPHRFSSQSFSATPPKSNSSRTATSPNPSARFSQSTPPCSPTCFRHFTSNLTIKRRNRMKTRRRLSTTRTETSFRTPRRPSKLNKMKFNHIFISAAST